MQLRKTCANIRASKGGDRRDAAAAQTSRPDTRTAKDVDGKVNNAFREHEQCVLLVLTRRAPLDAVTENPYPVRRIDVVLPATTKTTKTDVADDVMRLSWLRFSNNAQSFMLLLAVQRLLCRPKPTNTTTSTRNRYHDDRRCVVRSRANVTRHTTQFFNRRFWRMDKCCKNQ